MSLLESLQKQENEEIFHAAWSTFFLNELLVRQAVAEADQVVAAEVLKAGSNWNGSGWNTGRASKRLHDLVEVPLVTSNFTEYQNSFLYALALLWGIEVPTLELSDRAAQASFALARKFGDPPESEDYARQGQEEKPQDDVVMEWDEALSPLPQELVVLWQEVQAGTRKLQLAQVLDTVPKFQELPIKPAENNFRMQGRSSWDKQLKSYQQLLLHILRLWSTVYTTEDDAEGSKYFRMAWQLTAEAYFKIQLDRKEAAIPGSAAANVPAAPVLFGKEDLNHLQMVSKVNMAGKGIYRPPMQMGGKGRFRGFRGCVVKSQVIHSGANLSMFRNSFRGGNGFRGRFSSQGGYNFSHGGFNSGYSHGGSNSTSSHGGKGKSGSTRGIKPATNSQFKHHHASQVNASFQLVEEQSTHQSPGPNYTWCVTKLARTRPKLLSLPQGIFRRGCSQSTHGGVYKDWSSSSGKQSRLPYQIPHSLVPDSKARQEQTDSRLQGVEQIHLPPISDWTIGKKFSHF